MPDRNAPAANFDDDGEARESWALSDDRVPLFTVGRRDPETGEIEQTVVTMPRRPNPGLALRFLKLVRPDQMGQAGMAWLIEEAIGVEGFDLLVEELERNPEGATEKMQAISEAVQRRVMGGLEGPKA